MRCERCEGLMVTDHYIDMDGGGPWLKAWRCLCCGNVLDHQIKAHHSIAIPQIEKQRGLRKFTEGWRLKPRSGFDRGTSAVRKTNIEAGVR